MAAKWTKGLWRLGQMALLGIAIFSQTPQASSSGLPWKRIAANDTATIRYSGRIAWTISGYAGMSWPGTAATLRFQGTACRAVFKPRGGLYRIFIDGAPVALSTLNSSPNDTLLWLGKGLAEGLHTVTVYKRTEASMGTGVFAGFEIEGTPQPASPAPTKRIQFIGGAETCGDGILDSVPEAKPSPLSEDHYLSYASLTSRVFGAEAHSLCWSGIGLNRNLAGDTLTTMPNLYSRVDPTQPHRDYDFSWQPDAIVINLGAHDFAQWPSPDSARFVNSMTSFLKAIQKHHPQSRFVLVDGPLVSNQPCSETADALCASSLSQWRQYNAAAVAQFNLLSPGMASTLSLTPIAIQNSQGLAADDICLYPNTSHHALNASELVNHLSGQLGWAQAQALPILQLQKSKTFPLQDVSGHASPRRGTPHGSLLEWGKTPAARWILLGRQF